MHHDASTDSPQRIARQIKEIVSQCPDPGHMHTLCPVLQVVPGTFPAGNLCRQACHASANIILHRSLGISIDNSYEIMEKVHGLHGLYAFGTHTRTHTKGVYEILFEDNAASY